MLRTRIITGAVFFGAVCLILCFSHIPWVLGLTVALLCAGAMGEFGAAVGAASRWPGRVVGFLCGGLLTLVPGEWILVAAGVLLPVASVVYWRIMQGLPDRKTLAPWEKLLLGAAILVFLAVIRPLRQRPFGFWELALTLLVCMATDSFAYLIGRKYGRRPLAPTVSPKKTMEGAAGGSLAAAVLLVAVCAVAEILGVVQVRFGLLTLYVLFASVLGQYGDLCLSAVKRVAGIKDFGTLLPGHGGILDRFDSHLLVLPFTYVLFHCFGSVFY